MRILGVLIALCACAPMAPDDGGSPVPAADPDGTSPVLLTWTPAPGGAHHAMGVSGTLVAENGCLYLRTAAYRFLPVFPSGTSWDAGARGIRFGDQLLLVGERVMLSGDSLAGAAAMGPGFDPRGCDATRLFRVAPWRAG